MIERLRARVEIDPETGCWEWTGSKQQGGYGMWGWWADGKHHSTTAHRAVYREMVGPIPDGMTLDHLCRNRGCVNPGHVEPVSHAENVRRGVHPSGPRKTHCPQGHPYSGENLYLWNDPRGYVKRMCRTCNKARSKAWQESHR